jgi:BASS family bile acid:Na+ symporter
LFTFMKNWTGPALGFILFTMGLTLSLDSLRKVIREPAIALLSILGKWTFTLGVSILLAFLFFAGNPVLTAGIILAGAVPSGTSANLYTFMAGGTLALSIMMSAVDTVIGPLATPVIMKHVAGSIVPVKFFPVFLQMVYIVLLPILLGLLLQWRWEKRVAAVRNRIPLFSSAALLLIDLAVVSNAQPVLAAHLSLLPMLFFCVFLQVTLPMLLGYLYGFCIRAAEPDRRAIAYQFGICNTALAALLAMQHIDAMAAVPAVANMITNTTLGALIANMWEPLRRRWIAHKERQRAEQHPS